MITGGGALYQKSIEDIPELTKEMELELFTDLRYLEKNKEKLERKRNKTHGEKVRIGKLNSKINDVTSEIFKYSQNTVLLISKQYFKYIKNSTVCDEDDLIQESLMVMIEEVIPRFDIKRNLRLSTYAYWWIRQRIIKYLENTHMIKVPHSYLSKAKKDPSVLVPQVYSFDNKAGSGKDGEENDTFLNSMEDENTFDFIAEIEIMALRDVIYSILSEFTDKERNIIKMRFGFETEPKTLAKVGEKFGVTRERIRQIEEKVVKKINKRHGDLLQDFFFV